MKTKVIGAMNSVLLAGGLFASAPMTTFAEAGMIGGDSLIEADCDRQVSGTRTFPFFQGVLDSVADLNHDGIRVVCLQGTIVNDDRPAPPGRGDAPAVLKVWETGGVYSPLVVRGNNADGSRSRIRMTRTATGNSEFSTLFEGVTPHLTLENLEFILDYQRPAGSASAILNLYGEIQLNNVELRGISNGAYVSALYANGRGTIEDVDIRLVGTEGNSTALSVDGDFSSVRQVNVDGSGRTDLLKLAADSRIVDVAELSASGIDDGIVLDDNARINHLRASSFEAQGVGLDINGRGGIDVVGAASEYDETNQVTISACLPIRVARWGGIQSMKNAVFAAKRGC